MSCGVSSAENEPRLLAAGEEDAGVGAAPEDLLHGVARRLGGGQRRLDRLHQLLHERVDGTFLGHRSYDTIGRERGLDAACLVGRATRAASSRCARTAGGCPTARSSSTRCWRWASRSASWPSWRTSRVLLVRQYRHLAARCRGSCRAAAPCPERIPLAAAQRELREEGGYRAGRLEFLTRFYPSPAYLDETGIATSPAGSRPIPCPPTTTSSSSAGSYRSTRPSAWCSPTRSRSRSRS